LPKHQLQEDKAQVPKNNMDFGGTVPFTVNFFLQKKRLPKLTSIDKKDGIFIQTFEERETNPLKWVQLWLLPCNFEALAVYQIENDATQLLRRCSLNDRGWTSRSIRSKGVMTACLFCLLLSSLASFCQPGRKICFFWGGEGSEICDQNGTGLKLYEDSMRL